jgi:hypothetical protein
VDGRTVTRVEYRTRYRNRNVGCGCGGFFVVLIAGTVLALVNLAISIGVSVGIPFTHANITIAGSIGDKDKTADVLPTYTHGRVAGTQNFFNNTTTMTIWRAEGIGLVVIGAQDHAPAVDLHLAAR